jgi:hypothetical protein
MLSADLSNDRIVTDSKSILRQSQGQTEGRDAHARLQIPKSVSSIAMGKRQASSA